MLTRAISDAPVLQVKITFNLREPSKQLSKYQQHPYQQCGQGWLFFTLPLVPNIALTTKNEPLSI